VPRHVPARTAAIGLAIAAAFALAGCGRMAAALGQQWVVVQFNPNTSLAAARQVITDCSRLPGTRPEPVLPASPGGSFVSTENINVTNASSATLARLQVCLQRFGSVQGITLQEPGGG
jgi:hypothetical protein